MEILKHGFEKRMMYKFICSHCGCEFALNQFEMTALQNESKSTSTTSCNCPECGHTVSSYQITEQTIDHSAITQLMSSLGNIPNLCRNCHNHPSNGGSGICHCILGNIVTYS